MESPCPAVTFVCADRDEGEGDNKDEDTQVNEALGFAIDDRKLHRNDERRQEGNEWSIVEQPRDQKKAERPEQQRDQENEAGYRSDGFNAESDDLKRSVEFGRYGSPRLGGGEDHHERVGSDDESTEDDEGNAVHHGNNPCWRSVADCSPCDAGTEECCREDCHLPWGPHDGIAQER